MMGDLRCDVEQQLMQIVVGQFLFDRDLTATISPRTETDQA